MKSGAIKKPGCAPAVNGINQAIEHDVGKKKHDQ
jgi:hypothetical protein